MKWQIENEISQHQNRLDLIQQQNKADRERASEKSRFASAEFARLCDIFSLPHGSPTYVVTRSINDAIQKLEADFRVKDLMRVIDTAQQSLSAAKLRVAASGEGSVQ